MDYKNEESLIRSFRKTGDSESFGLLVTPYGPQMRSVALSILHHEADAMDSVQDAVIRAYQNIDCLADTSRFGGWLMRIVFGCSIDRLRSRNSGVEQHCTTTFDDPVCLRSRPGDRLDAHEWSIQISEAIKSLPSRYRSPLLLFHLDGLNTAQVAQHLNIPQGTARSLLTRARRLLGEQLDPDLQDIPTMANELFADQASAQGLLSQAVGTRLHVMNGDAAADRLGASGLADPMVVWADILHEGPTPVGVSPQQWRGARAEYLSSMGFGTAQQLEGRFEQVDGELANPGDGRERVFWFEHDLYDQLLLIRHLHWLSQHDADACRAVSLICVTGFPGIDRFVGLGQLEPDQIASLLETRQPISSEQISLGGAVWKDFCHSNPKNIHRWLTEETSALPFLQNAIRRHLQQYPSVSNGLGRTEQLILESVQSQPQSAGTVFAENQSREDSPFLGDSVVYHYISRLAKESTPALTIDSDHSTVSDQTEVTITGFGRCLLANEENRVQINGIDRWLGGVRLTGDGPIWRWDDKRQVLLQR